MSWIQAGPAQNTYLSDLADLGIFSISIPAEAGGAGGTVTDLAAALEQLAIALVPGPVTPNVLAGLLLTAAGSPLLPALAAGRATGAVGLTAGTLTGTRAADGTLHVTGQAGPVLGAGPTSHLVLGCTTDAGEAWFQLKAGCPGLTVTSRPPVDFSRSLADVSLAGAVIAADQVLTGLESARVRDLAATLFAAEAAGVAAWCSEHGGRLRRNPPPVRPPDRLVPGGQAPVRHHGLPGRTRRRPGLGCRPHRRRGARRAPVRRRGRRRAGAGRRGG